MDLFIQVKIYIIFCGSENSFQTYNKNNNFFKFINKIVKKNIMQLMDQSFGYLYYLFLF